MPTKKKKRDRFNGMSEDEVMKRELPDHLHENLDILIVRTAKKIHGTWILTAYLSNTHYTLILYLLYELWYIFLKNQKSMKYKVNKDINLVITGTSLKWNAVFWCQMFSEVFSYLSASVGWYKSRVVCCLCRTSLCWTREPFL